MLGLMTRSSVSKVSLVTGDPLRSLTEKQRLFVDSLIRGMSQTMAARKKVMDGMLEAIEMAKLQSEPATMVGGWREIGRMCGYYAAEKRVLDINITAKRAVDKLETLSDAELLEMIDKDSDMIEGEFTEVFASAEAN